MLPTIKIPDFSIKSGSWVRQSERSPIISLLVASELDFGQREDQFASITRELALVFDRPAVTINPFLLMG
ncbi:MAG TPA: hypothetical protein DDW76_26465 [Cyanobacteria bacterium UBA11369]|nr:hypothetical protein [Cyanobacteria bacterium UBA11371]HBE32549.1 hypothetical protein [Cyanobacteria bacterium UBA11368]HBE52216.1 hypothetical protein [Cyanobacteria bacterium UBA11369]